MPISTGLALTLSWNEVERWECGYTICFLPNDSIWRMIIVCRFPTRVVSGLYTRCHEYMVLLLFFPMVENELQATYILPTIYIQQNHLKTYRL